MSESLKILIVEDEAITALELKKKLVSWNYEIMDIVSSGENAIKRALQLKPDLILMDILLKGPMTGIDAALEIKNRIDIPIIYLTAYGNDDTFEGAKITQPSAYLIKPLQENELKFAIKMAFYGHKSQLKLKKRENHYRTLVERNPDLIFVINKNLRVAYANSTLLNFFKKTRLEIVGKHLNEIFPEEIFNSLGENLNQVFCLGKSVYSEDLVEFHDKSLWLNTCFKPLKDENGEINATLGISRDISQYKQMQEALQGQDNFDLQLIENMDHPVFYKDKFGIYRACNHAFEDLVGLTKEEIIGKSVHDVAPNKMADKYLQMDQELLEIPGVQYYDFQVQHADGTIRDILFNKITLKDSNNNLRGILGLMIDLTSFLEVESKIQSSQEPGVIIRDIYDNVKNDFNLISDIIYLQSDFINNEEVRLMNRRNEKRTQIMALAYEQLSSANDLSTINFDDYLKSVFNLISDFYKVKRSLINYQSNSKDISLKINEIIPLAFIVDELVSNVLEQVVKGEIGKLCIKIDECPSLMVVSVIYDGSGEYNIHEFVNGKLRFEIIKNMLSKINGELEFKTDNYSHFLIKVPKIVEIE